jgi:predicted ATP-grasp superfamily ATP-dependent carboligase
MARRILITDGDQRSALAAARSLVSAGFDVFVTAPRRWSLAGVSRGAHPLVVTTDAVAEPTAFAAEIAAHARELGIDLLLPVTDPAVDALLSHRALLPPAATLPFPPVDTYRLASNKVAMLSIAARAGLGVPESLLLRSRDDLGRVAGAVRLPAIVKPHASVVRAADGSLRKLGVTFVDDWAQCEAALDAYADAAFPVLLQRRVHGPGEGVFVLRWNGRTVARFAHRRLLEKPPAGGVSVYRESIPVPAPLAEAAERMMDALGWQGVAMVECKRDLRTNRHVFMEVNARLWGSLQLAIDAGVDFPALLAQCALGDDPAPRDSYRAGVRSRWWWGEVDHVYARLRRSNARLHLEGPQPSRLSAVLGLLRHRPGRDRAEIWRWRDPRPALLETGRRLHLVR